MAKSTRSKVKRSYRSKKRVDGVYAATEAARLHRLNAKLVAIIKSDKDGDAIVENEDEERLPDDDEREDTARADEMELDGTGPPSARKEKRISTHGPRGSRREEWRTSKGLSARPEPKGMNRQGTVSARRKAGRSKRRR